MPDIQAGLAWQQRAPHPLEACKADAASAGIKAGDAVQHAVGAAGALALPAGRQPVNSQAHILVTLHLMAADITTSGGSAIRSRLSQLSPGTEGQRLCKGLCILPELLHQLQEPGVTDL